MVVAGKVLLVAPAAMVTLLGALTTPVLLLAKAMVIPPVGAALVKVTVPVDELPPTTETGLILTEESAGGAGGGGGPVSTTGCTQ